jgi:hypothetical protein
MLPETSSFAHGLKLGGDLLQRSVRRGGGCGGDQPDQPVIALLVRHGSSFDASAACAGLADGVRVTSAQARKHALRCGGVDGIAQAAEMRGLGRRRAARQVADRCPVPRWRHARADKTAQGAVFLLFACILRPHIDQGPSTI